MTDYFQSEGLSFSGMKHLAISPLQYWHKRLDPNRKPEEPSREMQFGSALHCGVFETAKFDSLYCLRFEAPEGCLDTVEDMKKWLADIGQPSTAKKKQDYIDRILSIDPRAPILAIMERDYELTHRGKTFFKREEWDRLEGCSQALGRELRFYEMIHNGGNPEHPLSALDPDTGITLRSKQDWHALKFTADLKTFTQQRGKSIDKCVTDAIWYEGYYKQAWLYSYIRHLNGDPWLPFILVFVESDPPHEIRIRQLEPGNIYWEQAGAEVRSLIRLYADCMKKYGTDKPWRSPRSIEPLDDSELPQLAWYGFGGEVTRREWPSKAPMEQEEQRHFTLSPDQWKKFTDILDSTPVSKPELQKLFSEPSILERTPMPEQTEPTVKDKLTEIRQWMDSQPASTAEAFIAVLSSDIDRRPAVTTSHVAAVKKERKKRTPKQKLDGTVA